MFSICILFLLINFFITLYFYSLNSIPLSPDWFSCSSLPILCLVYHLPLPLFPVFVIIIISTTLYAYHLLSTFLILHDVHYLFSHFFLYLLILSSPLLAFIIIIYFLFFLLFVIVVNVASSPSLSSYIVFTITVSHHCHPFSSSFSLVSLLMLPFFIPIFSHRLHCYNHSPFSSIFFFFLLSFIFVSVAYFHPYLLSLSSWSQLFTPIIYFLFLPFVLYRCQWGLFSSLSTYIVSTTTVIHFHYLLFFFLSPLHSSLSACHRVVQHNAISRALLHNVKTLYWVSISVSSSGSITQRYLARSSTT